MLDDGDRELAHGLAEDVLGLRKKLLSKGPEFFFALPKSVGWSDHRDVKFRPRLGPRRKSGTDLP